MFVIQQASIIKGQLSVRSETIVVCNQIETSS